jgi:hypothetical protein
MQKNNLGILSENHFKIYILLKDKIVFENEVRKQQVKYYCDIENKPMLTRGIRYFIQDRDSITLDKILKENKIIASTESILISDYRDGIKTQRLYFKAAAIVIIILVSIAVIYDLLRKLA